MSKKKGDSFGLYSNCFGSNQPSSPLALLSFVHEDDMAHPELFVRNYKELIPIPMCYVQGAGLM
jgi:hypothetical protein